MIDILRAAVLGLVEGLTEFLPVSSTGHMLLVMPLLGVHETEPRWKVFLYFIQIGAIVAVLVHFRRPLVRAVFSRPTGGWRDHLLVKLVVACLPAGVIGLLFKDAVEDRLETPLFIAAALVAGALAMEWIERRFRRERPMSVADITLRHALWIGLAQCVSIVPGTSRSMATIMGGLIVGLSPAVAAEFSFFLAIPTLFGAGLLKLVKHRHDLHADAAAALGVGFAVAFVSAALVVEPFMAYVRTRRFRPFAIYRVCLGAVVVLAYALGAVAH